MKKIKFLSIILLALMVAIPVFGRDFGQEKNNFTGVQYFEGGVIFGSETDSLDTVTAVSNDPLMADADSAALVTEYAAKSYVDNKVPYTIYRGYLTQPTSTTIENHVLENTMCDSISWYRDDDGYYIATVYPQTIYPDYIQTSNVFLSGDSESRYISNNISNQNIIIVSETSYNIRSDFDSGSDGYMLYYTVFKY